jgi:VCBS repeat protein
MRWFWSAVFALFVGGTISAQPQNIFFQPPAIPSISGLPVTADINADGKPDLISNDGTVLLSNADGSLHTGTPWCSSAQPYCGISPIVVTDLNGDGKPDIVTVSPGFVWVLLGNGDGTFQAATSTATGTTATQFFVTDVNGDGKLDVLVPASGGGLLSLLGNGNGTFAAPTTALAMLPAGILAVGDFNGDGKVDLLVSPVATQVGVILGNGDGTFQTSVVYSITGFAQADTPAVVVGDLNGDGKADVVLSFNAIGTNLFSSTEVLLGNGDGTFTYRQVASIGGSPLLADLNGDGKLDLLLNAGGYFYSLLGNGDGTFGVPNSYFTGEGGAGAAFNVADFNGDGKLDVAAASSLFIGNGDGTFQGNSASLTVGGRPIPGDFNGDGKLDVAALADNNTVEILLGHGDGTFAPGRLTAAIQPGSSHTADLAVADVNGDGKLDLLVITTDLNNQQWTLNVLLGNGDGTFAAPIVGAQGAITYAALAVSDFNNDHKVDVAVYDTSGGVNIFLGQGDGTFTASTTVFGGSNPGSNPIAAADFNSDGKVDIVTASQSGVGILLGNGDGRFQPLKVVGQGIYISAVADLNGDGAPDLVMFDQVLLGNGDGTFRAVTFPDSVTYTVVEDINGDGILDLVGFGGGVNSQTLQYVLGNGDGTFAAPVVLELSGDRFDQIDSVVGGDFNGDGRPDILFTFAGSDVTLLNIFSNATADFRLSASLTAPAVVAPGSTATSTVKVTPIDGFNSSVALSCNELPTGATCAFSSTSISGAGSTTLTITTSATSPVGTYPVIVVGAGPSTTHSTVLTLTVASAPGATTVGLVPNVLTFPLQAVGSTSAQQIVQLTNSGTAALTFGSGGISVTGANAGDFSQTNNCGASASASVAAGTGCFIMVTFSPTGFGTRTATLMVQDNATGSPQTVVLIGSAPDFSVATSSSASATVTPGQTASYSFSIAPTGGFTQAVTFSCSDAPSMSSCMVTPSSVTLNGSGSTTVTVKVATTAATSGFVAPVNFIDRGNPNSLRLTVLALCVALAALLISFSARPHWGRCAAAAVFISVMFAAALLVACGGGSSSSSSGGGGGTTGTQAGMYTIVVTGTAGTGSSTTSHKISFNLTVN